MAKFNRQWRPFAAALAIIPASLAAPLAWADVKAGVDAWARGDYASAIREWRGPASKGDADAQFNLAQAYKLGRGVERDLSRAEMLFSQAAARGHLQAADNLGLLLFQRGERSRAMPYIEAAAGRGDPRAQYVLGLAHFNADQVEKDWVRAYALVSLAQQQGLPQAAGALSQMDQYIPLADRQKSVALAAQIAAQADATRARQVASADLGVMADGEPVAAPRSGSLEPFRSATPTIASAEQAVAAARGASPDAAGADYARPAASGVPPVATIMNERRPAPAAAPSPAPRLSPRPMAQATAPVAASGGSWRVQLGAFGVAGNADKLWARVRGRAELAGATRQLVPAGRVTKLQAGGFASRAAAQAACDRLKAGGFDCIVTGG